MANIITSPRYFKNKAILLKAEVTVGTDAVPTGAANWFEARNVQITPLDAQTVDRNIDQPYFGNGGSIMVAQYCKISFELAVAGSGTPGDAPKLAPALLACALAETLNAGTDAVYNLVSSSIGAATLYVNIDGTLHKMIGARGTMGWRLAAGAIPVFTFEFDAAFVDPAAVVLPAVVKTGWQVEEPVNAVNTTKLTLAGVDCAWSAFEISLNNQLGRIDLPGPQREVAITDRKPSGSVTVLAAGLATLDPFNLAKTATAVVLSTTHGSAAGNQVKFDVKARIKGAAYETVEGMLGYRLDLEPVPVDGNDEIAITFQ